MSTIFPSEYRETMRVRKRYTSCCMVAGSESAKESAWRVNSSPSSAASAIMAINMQRVMLRCPMNTLAQATSCPVRVTMISRAVLHNGSSQTTQEPRGVANDSN
eukprot:10122007-Alexandrium_andersonii.AAC.1